jgi:hypothetical protein
MINGLIFAMRRGILRDWLQWRITGTSPMTRSVDIAPLIEAIRRNGVVRDDR